ncbi:phage holin family protein [Flavobacterium sp. MAH-1]|uniref:Phage holin family protein n=1 Tax=Flavobacterium agri TaxID=2743471 RepID=A0A7Y8Y094_9FLAO|nr:phage holin family protein [Flavobacterium agri]NUY80108.1 phage holin family protein [Flavobacterium agri]NYA70133.1 phage holin family protein [Flavobacterium agri]
MALEDLKENAEDLKENVKGFIDSNIAYYKLWFFKVAMKSTTMLLKLLLIAIFLTLVLVFLSVAAAIAIGYALDNLAYGFLIVGGFYIILSVIVYNIKDKIVEGPILEKFSEFFFNE